MRAARRDDQPSLFLLTSQFPTNIPCSHDVFCGLLDAKLQDPTACVMVAEHNQRLVGYVSGSARTAFFVGGMTAWVDEILVLPDCRRQGVGGKLMEAFEKWASRYGCRSVALATRVAAPFYERLGYSASAVYLKKYLDQPKAT